MVEKNELTEDEQATPVCEKCGSVLLEEEGKLVCPHCQGEINFMADDDE